MCEFCVIIFVFEELNLNFLYRDGEMVKWRSMEVS